MTPQPLQNVRPSPSFSGKADLHSVVVLGPVTQGRSNWHIGTSSNGPNLVSAPCRMELNLIVGRLQGKIRFRWLASNCHIGLRGASPPTTQAAGAAKEAAVLATATPVTAPLVYC